MMTICHSVLFEPIGCKPRTGKSTIMPIRDGLRFCALVLRSGQSMSGGNPSESGRFLAAGLVARRSAAVASLGDWRWRIYYRFVTAGYFEKK